MTTHILPRNGEKSKVSHLNFRYPRRVLHDFYPTPPYGTNGLADLFVRRALIHCQQTGGSVAMLLNLRSLCNPDRVKKFTKTPPTAIYALDELICWPAGKPCSYQARIAQQQYYWAVWHPGKVQRPAFWWLSTKPFKKSPL